MKLVLIGIVGIVMFAASALGSWYVKSNILTDPNADSESELIDITADPLNEKDTGESQKPDLMPVAVRDSPMSVEELIRMSFQIKEARKKLVADQETFQKGQIRKQLVLEDMKAEETVLDGLQTKLDKDLTTAESMIAELNTLRDAVLQQREEAKAALEKLGDDRIRIEGEQQAKEKKISEFLQGMAPEKSAESITAMVNDGDLIMAARILNNFETRQAGKILEEIEDMKIVNSLILKIREIDDQKKQDRN